MTSLASFIPSDKIWIMFKMVTLSTLRGLSDVGFIPHDCRGLTEVEYVKEQEDYSLTLWAENKEFEYINTRVYETGRMEDGFYLSDMTVKVALFDCQDYGAAKFTVKRLLELLALPRSEIESSLDVSLTKALDDLMGPIFIYNDVPEVNITNSEDIGYDLVCIDVKVTAKLKFPGFLSGEEK